MFSDEHKKYLRKIKLNNNLVKIFQFLIFLIFIVIWQLLANTEKINTFIFSSPYKVITTIISLYQDNNLFYHIWVTVYETLVGFSLGCIIGIALATILWSSKFLYKVIDPYLTILNSLPKVALGPIIIIWGGANTTSIIIMALLISVIITTINVHQGFSSTDTNKIRFMKSLGASKWQIYSKLVLPSNLGTIMSAIKINISMSLIGVIMGEFLTSKAGIGHLIMYGSQVFNLTLVISGVIILMIVSYLMYLLINYIEKILIKS